LIDWRKKGERESWFLLRFLSSFFFVFFFFFLLSKSNTLCYERIDPLLFFI